MWTDCPIFSMQGTPTIALSQGVLLCATLHSASHSAFGSCCIHGLQLQPALARAGCVEAGEQGAGASPQLCGAGRGRGGGLPQQWRSGGGGSSSSPTHAGLKLLSVSPSKRGGCVAGSPLAGCPAAAAAGAGGRGGSGAAAAAAAAAASGSSSRPAEAIGSGATAQARVAVATAGGVAPGSPGLSASSTIMLAVSDHERLCWSGRAPLVDDTGGRLTALLTTPTQLVMATEQGGVLGCALLPPPAAPGEQQQQQQQQQQGAGARAFVRVEQPCGAGSRFIHLDL
jgi:hypothetical protein